MPVTLERAPDLAQALKVNLVVLRARRGWSQQKLATAAGISRVLVSQLERGLANFTADTLERLGRALRVDPRALLEPADASPADDRELERRLASGERVGARALLEAFDESKAAGVDGRARKPVARRAASKGSAHRRRAH